ncbi:hypothetical protein [Niabella hirudinis]|uniref:DUF6438 domain-containing protein n=1 Tax=Niabella hirudinis TaxID=1285929 RepID=UPI003EB8981D
MRWLPLLLLMGMVLEAAGSGGKDARSEIDRIATVAAVDSFLQRHIPSYEGFHAAPPFFRVLPRKADIYRYFTDSLSLSLFSKSDLDQNGKTDLLINGSFNNRPAALLVLDKGTGRFEHRFFTSYSSGDQQMVFMRFKQQGRQPLLDYYLFDTDRLFDSIGYRKFRDEFKTGFLTHRQLLCKQGFIVEADRHGNPVFSMKVLEIDRAGIFKEYAHYKIRVLKTGRAILLAGIGSEKVLEKKQYGIYRARLKRKDLRRLKQLVCYLDPYQLQCRYTVNAADVPYVTVVFTDREEREKQILDRGLMGTVGLSSLYRYIDALVGKQKWKKGDSALLDARWSYL